MKIGIVGSGLVGATAAYAMIMRGIGREIVLLDLNAKRAIAEAEDLFHAVPFAHALNVIGTDDYAALEGCRVVVIAAGVSQKPGETRLHLLERNAAVFRAVVPQVLTHAPDAILLIATNPVDVMTHLAAHYAAEFGVPSSRVIGSGTTLDTARYRVLLGQYLGVDSHHVHAYVVGEHGDSEVLTWSLATVGGVPIKAFCRERELPYNAELRTRIDKGVRHAAYSIIEGKGSTYYGIGSALARIVQAILSDQRSILTVCTPLEQVENVKDVTVALPHLVGGVGILDSFTPELSAVEHRALAASASIVREAIDSLFAAGAV